jgi:hypothetical protein
MQGVNHKNITIKMSHRSSGELSKIHQVLLCVLTNFHVTSNHEDKSRQEDYSTLAIKCLKSTMHAFCPKSTLLYLLFGDVFR